MGEWPNIERAERLQAEHNRAFCAASVASDLMRAGKIDQSVYFVFRDLCAETASVLAFANSNIPDSELASYDAHKAEYVACVDVCTDLIQIELGHETVFANVKQAKELLEMLPIAIKEAD